MTSNIYQNISLTSTYYKPRTYFFVFQVVSFFHVCIIFPSCKWRTPCPSHSLRFFMYDHQEYLSCTFQMSQCIACCIILLHIDDQYLISFARGLVLLLIRLYKLQFLLSSKFQTFVNFCLLTLTIMTTVILTSKHKIRHCLLISLSILNFPALPPKSIDYFRAKTFPA